MPPVNVLLSGLSTSLCLSIGDSARTLHTGTIADAVIAATGLPRASFFLRQHGALLHPSDPVSVPGQHTTFLTVCLRRALPGGKGGFGAMLRGSAASKTTTNFDACRDLEGRRLRHVREEEEIRRFLRERREREGREREGEEERVGVVERRKRRREGGVAVANVADVADERVDVEKVGEDMDRIGQGVSDAVADALEGAGRTMKRLRTAGDNTADRAGGLDDWMIDCGSSSEGEGSGSDGDIVLFGKGGTSGSARDG